MLIGLGVMDPYFPSTLGQSDLRTPPELCPAEDQIGTC